MTRSTMSINQMVLSSPTVTVVVRRIDLLSIIFRTEPSLARDGASTVTRSAFIKPPELSCAAWTGTLKRLMKCDSEHVYRIGPFHQ